MRREIRGVIRGTMLAGAFIGAVAACTSDDSVSIMHPDASKLFWALEANAKAVTVAIGGTQQLSAAALYASGDTMPDVPRPTFMSLETSKVTVDSNGMVTGVSVTSGVDVIASLTIDGLTHADTIVVAVTPTASTISTFAMVGLGGVPVDSNMTINGFTLLDYKATDASGDDVFGLAVSVRALDPLTLTAGSSYLQGNVIGKTKVIMSSLSYGQFLADTVEFRVLYASAINVYTSGETEAGPMSFSPNAVVIGTGGTVTWYNYFYGQLPASIIFDPADVDKIPDGNIDGMNWFDVASRTFPVAGTYKYTNTLNGGTGTVIVREQPEL